MSASTWRVQMWRRALFCCCALLGLVAVACGDRAVGDEGPCPELCRELRPKLINNVGIKPERIDCQAAKWSEARTCAACFAIFKLEFDVQPTSDSCPVGSP